MASTDFEGVKASGKMIFEPILRDGVFRFDCGSHGRANAFPSLSFAYAKERDKPITSNTAYPSYVPTFECLFDQQIVTLEVSHLICVRFWVAAYDCLSRFDSLLFVVLLFELKSFLSVLLFMGLEKLVGR